MTTSPSPGQELPSHYRSKQAFLSSLPPWRQLLAKLNWHPTVELKVQRYAIEQRLKRLDELNSKLDALLCSSSTSSTPPQNTPDSSEA
jgi:hypothetical protein